MPIAWHGEGRNAGHLDGQKFPKTGGGVGTQIRMQSAVLSMRKSVVALNRPDLIMSLTVLAGMCSM